MVVLGNPQEKVIGNPKCVVNQRWETTVLPFCSCHLTLSTDAAFDILAWSQIVRYPPGAITRILQTRVKSIQKPVFLQQRQHTQRAQNQNDFSPLRQHEVVNALPIYVVGLQCMKESLFYINCPLHLQVCCILRFPQLLTLRIPKFRVAYW